MRRSDGSGTTYIFSNYLSAVSPAWAAEPGADRYPISGYSWALVYTRRDPPPELTSTALRLPAAPVTGIWEAGLIRRWRPVPGCR